MASLRRNRTMPTDGAISKFLYVIMKQLDLKSIDWQQVADQLDITNGHAARMRYSRFKQQMEGVAPAPRKARAAVPRQRTSKPDKSDKNKTQPEEHQGTVFKADKEENMDAMSGVEQTVKEEHFVKPEPEIKAELGGEEDGTWSPDDSADADAMQQMSLESAAFVNHGNLVQYSPVETPQISPELVAVKPEPVVKIEPLWEN